MNDPTLEDMLMMQHLAGHGWTFVYDSRGWTASNPNLGFLSTSHVSAEGMLLVVRAYLLG